MKLFLRNEDIKVLTLEGKIGITKERKIGQEGKHIHLLQNPGSFTSQNILEFIVWLTTRWFQSSYAEFNAIYAASYSSIIVKGHGLRFGQREFGPRFELQNYWKLYPKVVLPHCLLTAT